MDDARIVRAAINRVATLGDLYDARKDEFIGKSAFVENWNRDDMYEEELDKSEFDFISSEPMEERFKKLGIDTELSLSILCGLLKLSGSAMYLDQKSNAKSAEVTLTYSVRTRHQEIDGIRRKVNKNCLNGGEATHIVVGIGWGVKCNITCNYRMGENEDDKQVEKTLKAAMEKLKYELPDVDNENVESSQEDREHESSCSYHIYCDASEPKNDISFTVENAMSVARYLQKEATKATDGKDVPIMYTLLPVSSLCTMLKLAKKSDESFNQIGEHIASKVFETIQTINNIRQQICDLVEVFNENKSSVSSEELCTASKLLNDFDREEERFKCELSNALVRARSRQEKGESTIIAVLESFLQGDFSAERVNAAIEKHERTMQKLKLIDQFKYNKVLYIGKDGGLEHILYNNPVKQCYIFYMDHSKMYTDNQEWQKYYALFSRLISAHKDDDAVLLSIIDCEFLSDTQQKKSLSIQFYENNSHHLEDIMKGEAQDFENCLIEMNVKERSQRKPSKRVVLQISCPKSLNGSCAKSECQWRCNNCKETIEYGVIDKFLYCSCGRANALDVNFRCNDIKHGIAFDTADKKILQEALSSFVASVKEINLVLLGETGVGKSTWVNSIANYFAFSTLKDAIDVNDMRVYIPSTFSYTSNTDETSTITVGSENENEVHKAGQSGTQMPREYTMNIGKRLLNIIDTPGLGDPRGLDQDSINSESILSHLSNYNEIHGICIFLKPNDPRLTSLFRFVITELLTHLHKSAANNIVFCFTNARSTFYKPGEALPKLKSLLQEYKGAVVNISQSNQFCFDNEGFRCLACLENGIKFSQQEIDIYSDSWDKAVAETSRLLTYVAKLVPHSMENTVSLNKAKTIIHEMSKPLAETISKIQMNIVSATAKKTELRESNMEDKIKLRALMNLTAFELEYVKLDLPRTVCTHKSCVEYTQVKTSLFLI